MSALEEFYERAAERFTPGGPGRVDWYMTDSEIVEMLKATNPGYEKTGALFVIPTPAGIVAIKPAINLDALAPEPGSLERDMSRLVRRQWPPLALEAELRPGRHDCGYSHGRLMFTSARLQEIVSGR